MENIDFHILESKQVKMNFEDEINILEREGGVLLGAIQMLEDYLDYKKSNDKIIDDYDLNEMKETIIKFLHILSLIDVYQYFHNSNRSIPTKDDFFSMVDSNYIVRINKFINDLNDLNQNN